MQNVFLRPKDSLFDFSQGAARGRSEALSGYERLEQGQLATYAPRVPAASQLELIPFKDFLGLS